MTKVGGRMTPDHPPWICTCGYLSSNLHSHSLSMIVIIGLHVITYPHIFITIHLANVHKLKENYKTCTNGVCSHLIGTLSHGSEKANLNGNLRKSAIKHVQWSMSQCVISSSWWTPNFLVWSHAKWGWNLVKNMFTIMLLNYFFFSDFIVTQFVFVYFGILVNQWRGSTIFFCFFSEILFQLLWRQSLSFPKRRADLTNINASIRKTILLS